MAETMISVKVAAKLLEADNIYSFKLVSLEGDTLPSFSAGSHVDVEIKPGLIRQYSLCNEPSASHFYQIAVLRDPQSRGGSIAIHDEVEVGSILRISAPKNHFELVHEAQNSILFAGGIGITPILCMAERLAMAGSEFRLHYCARAESAAAFTGRMRDSQFADRVEFHFDDGNKDQTLDIHTIFETSARDAHIYVCGPKGFIDFVASSAEQYGLPSEQIHFEHFAADPASASGDAFDILLSSSGKVIHVAEEQTALEALADAGIELDYSCEQGVCGTCVTRVLEGVPDHRDLYFNDEERRKNDQFLPCCSRSRSPRLVLDL
ncbi:PDR/VanB family oxidoreductase [Amphritea sp.]|uniref:PDR/VanB family oxidoreductase n=1 Tax=Amphritea sp. TaxID=1872502 RepID=UPI003D0B602E